MKFINNLYDKYLHLYHKFISIRYEFQIEFIKNFLNKKNIKSIIEIGCDKYSISDYIQLQNDIKYMGIFTNKTTLKNYQFNKNRFSILSNSNSRFIFKKNSIDHKIPDSDLYIIKNINYLDYPTINKMMSILKTKPYRYILIIHNSASINNIEVINGLYKPINLVQLPYDYNKEKKWNWKFSIESTYYDKWLVIIGILFLCFVLFLTIKKKYKLYIFVFISLIIGMFVFFPQTNLVLLKNNKFVK